MCAMSTNVMDQMESYVTRLYTLLGAQMKNAGVVLGEDLPDGFKTLDRSGVAIVHSPFEMGSIVACVQRVYESWTQSGEPPDAKGLRSWFESLDASQEERISTLWSAVSTLGLRLSIASGDLDTVLRTFETLSVDPGPKPTAQSTSLKTNGEPEPGTSSESPPPGIQSGGPKKRVRKKRKKNPNGVRNPDKQAGNSTVRKDLQENDQKKPKKEADIFPF